MKTNYPAISARPGLASRDAGQFQGARLSASAVEEPPLELTVNVEPEKTTNKDVATAYYLFTAFNIVVALYHIIHFILKGSI